MSEIYAKKHRPGLLTVFLPIFLGAVIFGSFIFKKEIPYKVFSFEEAPQEFTAKFSGRPFSLEPGSSGSGIVGSKMYGIITPPEGELVEIIGVEKSGIKGVDIKYRTRKLKESTSENQSKIVEFGYSKFNYPLGIIKVE